jgi:hypothetical protein
MSRALRSACLFAFVSVVAVLSMPGCSQQGEGERCDNTKNGNADCNDNLTCVPKGELAVHTADRCCPAANTETDSRCHRLGSSGNTAGSGSVAGSSSGGSSGSGGAPSAGESSGGAAVLPTAGSTSSSDGGMSGAATNNGGMSGSPEAGAAPSDPSGGKGGAP